MLYFIFLFCFVSTKDLEKDFLKFPDKIKKGAIVISFRSTECISASDNFVSVF